MADQPHPSAIWCAFSDMENDIADVWRWSQVFHALGTCGTSYSPEALAPIADAVSDLHRRLQAKWDYAADLARLPL